MFDGMLAMNSGVNRWFHYRASTPVEAHSSVLELKPRYMMPVVGR
jgi:hypothetical protein